jgi:hypothetical protein
MSASQVWSGAAVVKFRSSRFGAIGKSSRLAVVRIRRGRAMISLDASAARGIAWQR